MKPSLLAALVCALSACLFVAEAPAAPLAVPSPDALSARLKAETVAVVEPHLTVGTSTTQRRYVGYPARALLDAAGVAYETDVGVGDVAHTLVDMIERSGCDMVIIGAKGHSSLREMGLI